MRDDSNHPPGWLADPTRRHSERFWDGTAWTQHVRTNEIPGVDPFEEERHLDEPQSTIADVLKADRSAQLAAIGQAVLSARTVVGAAATDVGLVTRKGKISKFGLAKAAARPMKTSKKVAGSLTSAIADQLAAPASIEGDPENRKRPSAPLPASSAPIAGNKMIIHEIITALQVREAALLFRGCIESPSGFGTKDLTWSFFEPESVTDPFAVLDSPAEEPSFTVGASYRLRDTRLGYQSGIREKVQQSSHGTLILLVFERGDHRLLEVQQQGALSLASKKVAKGFLEALAGADETASISTEKTRR